ncbi:MAG TPA: SAV_2336 N-terminal domain-related protein, partial [Candidatus Nanopelagicales bacterium]|nr:SAV_2336 N-terminal domain-related protein [Candidatus Nanopelagicales bacterium]
MAAATFPDFPAEQLADAVLIAARQGGPGNNTIERVTPSSAVHSTTSDDVGEEKPAPRGDALQSADLSLPMGKSDSLRSGNVSVTKVGLEFPAPGSLATASPTALSLFRRISRPGPPAVDVDATVEATADARRLVVVTRPSRERGLDAAIVVDPTLAAEAWARGIDELEGTLRRTGAFRSVTRWELAHTNSPGLGQPLIRDRARTAHRPDQLVDPSGRRLVLVLSDFAGAEWQRSGPWQVLIRWARVMPTAMLHLLPPSYWGWTAVGQPSGVLRALRPASPNSATDFRPAWWCDDTRASNGVAVPVIDLESDAIVRWARAIVDGTVWSEAVWAVDPPRPGNGLVSEGILSDADRVGAFEMRASTGAQQLARILASAPLLSLPLIQILHEQLIPRPLASQVAELMVSGLLEELPKGTDAVGPRLQFHSGVSDLLSRGTTISQEWDLYDLLSRALEKQAGSGNVIQAFMADSDGARSVAAELVPFAAMGRKLAHRLGLELGTRSSAASSVLDASLGRSATLESYEEAPSLLTAVEGPDEGAPFTKMGMAHRHQGDVSAEQQTTLDPIQEAVDTYRALAETNPAAYIPDLAASLRNHAARLAELGRREDALAPSEEAVTLYRELVGVNPAAYIPDLAASLRNHAA